MNKTLSTGFKHWTLHQLRWHHTQVVPVPTPAIGDQTLHPVSVVVVIARWITISVATKFEYRSLTVHHDETEGMESKAAPDEYPPRGIVDNN